MRERKVRIVSAATPFVLRSAVHMMLDGDPRFRSFLLPAGASVTTFSQQVGAELVVLSEAANLTDRTSVILLADPPRIEVRIRNASVFLPYTDLKSLADILWLNKQSSDLPIRSRAGPRAPTRYLGGGMQSHAKKGGP